MKHWSHNERYLDHVDADGCKREAKEIGSQSS